MPDETLGEFRYPSIKLPQSPSVPVAPPGTQAPSWFAVQPHPTNLWPANDLRQLTGVSRGTAIPTLGRVWPRGRKEPHLVRVVHAARLKRP